MKYEIHDLELPDVKLIAPCRIADERGWLCENYDGEFFAQCFGHVDFQREVTSFSHSGVLRGMHFEVPGNVKLVRVVQGCVYDVVVDIRHESDTFGRWASVELSSGQGSILYIPTGFAHGYYSREDSLILYKLSNLYEPSHARTMLWNDRDLSIEWPVLKPELSNADRKGANFAEYSRNPDY